MAQQQLETLFEFPCTFPIKVMASTTVDLKPIVTNALTAVGIALTGVEMDVRASTKGNYISLTAIFEAQSKEQLDALYQSLSQHPDVKMVL